MNQYELSAISASLDSFMASVSDTLIATHLNNAQMASAVNKMWDAIVNAPSKSYDTILVFDLDSMNPIDATVLVLTLRAYIENVDIVVDKTAVNGITSLSGFLTLNSENLSASRNLQDRGIQVTLKWNVSDCTFEGVVAVLEKKVSSTSDLDGSIIAESAALGTNVIVEQEEPSRKIQHQNSTRSYNSYMRVKPQKTYTHHWM